MLLQLTIIACSLILSTIAGCLIGYWGFRKRKRAVFEEGLKLYTQQIPFGAYCRYAQVRQKTISQVHNQVWIWGILLPLPAIIGNLLASSIIKVGTSAQASIGIATRSALIGLVIGVGLFEFISDARLDLAAMRIFEFNPLEHSRFIKADLFKILSTYTSAAASLLGILIYFLLYPPRTLLINIIFKPPIFSIIFGSIANAYFFVFITLIVIATFTFTTIFTLPYANLTSSLQHIEETQWANLIPRIHSWSRLAGVEFSAVLIAQDLFGGQEVRLSGPGRRPALIISEALLRAGDWRVHDTIICQGIIMHKQKSALKLLMAGLTGFGTFIAWVLLAPMLLQLPSSLARDITFDMLLIGIPITIILAMALIVGLKQEDTHNTAIIKLTGDPLALLVLHHVRVALNGSPFTSDNLKTAKGRFERLIAELHTGSRLAPYATTPVPSPLKIRIEHEQITIPLNQATPPAPVPEVTYGNLAS
ncbi:hypothetical protein KSC_091870 [Ktedonobacter sp. SOSP1-52]|uniref:hypothetical protein n=1 Tax=Ktedonobacter sp. SOSP1-52 TaxID=2778366 RepID=UPI001914F22E|nr:hypothetical protein [Ktedonobacter sp. SOSP1-52]GHO70295.1 hypothetical protein KSC_091870 [Ktedonobacter sp. SOSP1-52]